MEKGAAQPQTKRAQPAQGRADLRALTQPGRRRRQAPKQQLKQHIEKEEKDEEDPEGI
ncbi:hypothetical protein SapgrDRAFT_0532 [Saprospira grandis DSM 2844]|uniref:Uncharacterized protein n=1 Tax=Saprospira grandis DSM 2844 TaxID=694433 RepID=J0XTN0_9BACT|nr:hypothetical protein SapgrDRAFT_0532 [Saprospira grandis DSM 2844]